MMKLFEKRVVLAVFLLATAILAATSAIAEQSIFAGANDIIISDDMAGKTLEDMKGTCSLIIGAFVYDAKTQPAKLVPVHIYGDPPYSQKISDEMVGKGLRVVSAENCKLATSGTTPYLKKASVLTAGWNFISVTNGMKDKAIDEVKGTCSIEKVRFYSPTVCKAAREELGEEQLSGTCEGDYSIINPATKLNDYYIGKGIWVKVTSDCILDDGTPSEILCSESECSAKSSCLNSKYITYGCRNKECVEVSRSECPAEEEPVASANLVPELVISPSANIKGGDTIKVTLFVKNTGTKNAHYSDIIGGNSIGNVIHFYREQEYGGEVPLPSIQASLSLLTLPDGAIKPGDAGKVKAVERSVKLPEDFSGKLAIVAIVDTHDAYPESPGSAELDNKLLTTVTVRPAAQPDLVALDAEAAPSLETIPVTVLNIIFKVQNLGEKPAVAEEQFLAYKISITKGNDEVCKGYKSGTETIMPNEVKPHAVGVKSASGSPCVIEDKQANYWVVVEVDAVGTGKPRGAVLESNETNNKRSFQIKGPQTCSPPGSREAGEGGKYCSIGTGTWFTQKTPGQTCSHNFECKTDMCIKNKCVSEEKKAKILEILG